MVLVETLGRWYDASMDLDNNSCSYVRWYVTPRFLVELSKLPRVYASGILKVDRG